MVGPPSSWSPDQEDALPGSWRSSARFIFDNSLLLLAGTVAAVVWPNVDFATYDAAAHPLHVWINDVGMVFFFALAAKEIFEATLPGIHARRTSRFRQWSRGRSFHEVIQRYRSFCSWQSRMMRLAW